MITSSRYTPTFSSNIYIVLIGCMMMSFNAVAQIKEDSVLLNIGGDKITVSEVMSLYRRNNVKGAVPDKKSFAEYLELFINYKLKIDRKSVV